MQINDQVHMLKIPFTVSTPNGPIPRFVNVFLVCTDTVTLIDAGVAGASEAVFGYLQSIGRTSGHVARLFLTHAHPDHIGGAAGIVRETGCTVLAAAGERSWIEDTERQCRERPVPGFQSLVEGPVAVDTVIAAGDAFPLDGGLALEVLETPGHSAASLSFLLQPHGILISGDAIPLPVDMPIYDDYRQSLRSLQELSRKTGVTQVLESWRDPGQDVQGRFREGMEWLQTVDRAVQAAVEEGEELPPMELSRRVVAALGLPHFAANPLVERSLRSHLV